MKVIISPRAEKEIRKLPKFDQIAVIQKIRSFANLPILNEEKLSGYPHVYRVRVGNYRIVYKRTNEYISVVLIRNRRDVYRMLKELLK